MLEKRKREREKKEGEHRHSDGEEESIHWKSSKIDANEQNRCATATTFIPFYTFTQLWHVLVLENHKNYAYLHIQLRTHDMLPVALSSSSFRTHSFHFHFYFFHISLSLHLNVVFKDNNPQTRYYEHECTFFRSHGFLPRDGMWLWRINILITLMMVSTSLTILTELIWWLDLSQLNNLSEFSIKIIQKKYYFVNN